MFSSFLNNFMCHLFILFLSTKNISNSSSLSAPPTLSFSLCHSLSHTHTHTHTETSVFFFFFSSSSTPFGFQLHAVLSFSSPVQTDPGTHPASYTMGTGSLYQGKEGRAWRLPAFPHLAQRLLNGVVSLLPCWAFMSCFGVKNKIKHTYTQIIH
jgi:hypothetical protein